MKLTEEELEIERKYLEITINVIKKIIEDGGLSISNDKSQIVEVKKFIWENRGTLDEIEISQHMYDVNKDVTYTNKKIERLEQLKKSLSSAYFGRIDFLEDGDLLKIYIGINGVLHENYFYVVDWRTPIASLFYNNVKGLSSYESPSGEISGEIMLKRQYKISYDNIERCFDSELNIDDEYLQEVLNGTSGDKMKNIVNTIQREQNEIIRNLRDKVMIVQGIAGSGKTSVALHRIAYLLYQEKNLNSNNVLIFSPNEVFSEYISNVLPELGEENVLQTTFNDFSKSYLKKNNYLESFTEMIENYYMQKDKKYDHSFSMFKHSNEIKKYLDNYISKIGNDISFTSRLTIDEKEFDTDYLNDLLKRKYIKMPLFERIEYIAEHICDLSGISFLKNKKAIISKLTPFLNFSTDVFALYESFLNDYLNPIFNYRESFNVNKIYYEDLVLILYLKFQLFGYPLNKSIKHVVIDEAQDYNSLQVHLLKEIFKNASFTILGDHNQTINPFFKYNSLEEIGNIFPNSKYIELNKTYRSTGEIIDYTSKILDLKNSSAIRGENQIPVISRQEGSDLFNSLVDDIDFFRNNGLKRNAIITKNMHEAKNIYKKIADQLENVYLPNMKMTADKADILIMPSYLAKGLEFDGVIVYTKPNNAYDEDEKYLFYVACTRAQHGLIVYNQEKKLVYKK